MVTKELVRSEVEDYAKFDLIRYAQVWEDAEILIEALQINEDDNILSPVDKRHSTKVDYNEFKKKLWSKINMNFIKKGIHTKKKDS